MRYQHNSCGRVAAKVLMKQMIGGEKQKTKCVDDNLTIVGPIVDYGSHFFRHPTSIPMYEGCNVFITEGGGI